MIQNGSEECQTIDTEGAPPYKSSDMFRSPGPVALQIGPLSIRWYGILMALAMAIGLWLAYRDARRRGLDPENLLKAAELGLLGALVGARLYYVLFNLDYYTQFPRKIIAVWEGGLAIHGGIIGGILVGGGYAYLRKLPVREYLDIAAPGLVLGQAIGRWGNYFNEEAFGTPTTLPWKLYISPSHRPLLYAQDDFFHPAFLYESIWDLAVFFLLALVLRKRLRPAKGALFLAYIGLYSMGRFITEGLRTDPLMFGSIRVAQVVSLLSVAAALIAVPIMLRRTRA